MLGQDVSEFYQARGAPHIAEVGLGKFGDGPVGVLGEVAHAQLLGQRVTLGAAEGF